MVLYNFKYDYQEVSIHFRTLNMCPLSPLDPPLLSLAFPVDSKKKKVKWQVHHVLQDDLCQKIDDLPDMHKLYELGDFRVSEVNRRSESLTRMLFLDENTSSPFSKSTSDC